MAQSAMSQIINYPAEPVELFKQLLATAPSEELQPMNLATIDDEFGVLNRTVLYRGLTDNCVTYITQRYTRNYENLVANPRVCITFYLPQLKLPEKGNEPQTWQVRLLGATAVELAESQVQELWTKEELPAQIRAHIFPCGKPVDYEKLKAQHDNFLDEHLKSGQPLQRPATYTAFKFEPQRWDFLKVGDGQIADRLQYRLLEDGQWQAMHVAT